MHSEIAGGEGRVAQIMAAFAAAGVNCYLKTLEPEKWDRTLSELRYIPVAYSPASIDYQLAYQRGHGGEWSDISLVLLHDQRPCGVWPMSFSVKDDRSSVTSHGLPVLPPLFVTGLPDRSRKGIVQNCLRAWEEICVANEISPRVSIESFVGSEAGLSEWHDQSLRNGAQATLRHELFVDLSLDLDAIKARFRKSYRSLITSGTRTWRVGTMTSSDPSTWSEFRELHLQVSGRITRSADSWDLQHRAIVQGDAFLVFLRDSEDKMVGGGFFSTTRDECAYGVGTYDRSLFEKPLGHVVQYCAIELMKARELRWYKIGQRPYPSEQPRATDKEFSIAEFKQGFATHLFPQYVLQYDAQAIGR